MDDYSMFLTEKVLREIENIVLSHLENVLEVLSKEPDKTIRPKTLALIITTTLLEDKRLKIRLKEND